MVVGLKRVRRDILVLVSGKCVRGAGIRGVIIHVSLLASVPEDLVSYTFDLIQAKLS